MDPRFKERLIGAAVLVALGVWLIPWVLDGQVRQPETAAVSLQLPSLEESAPVRSQTIDLDRRVRAAARIPLRRDSRVTPPKTAASSAAARESDHSTVQADGHATAGARGAETGEWMVQIGSFGEAENAERLAVRVASYGFDADVSPYRAGGRVMHRVRVGPHDSRGRAEATASSLSAHGFVAQVVITN